LVIAMSHVEAIYRHGVFEPLQPVELLEDQRVLLSFEPADRLTAQGWLDKVRQLQTAVLHRQGYLPDSASDIAADRMR
jgi:predicted DNA-binding antitoxin AbrB/MazE fold protein